MINKDEIISVTNRDSGSVGYTIEDLGIRRVYRSGETKDVTMEELRKLSYQPGGLKLLKDHLVMNSKEAVEELLHGEVEPEYYYSKEDVRELLLNGTLDQLRDCLDFAPSGVVDLVKDYAVDLEVNDLAKREAILKATGFNVTKAIEIKHESAAPETDAKPSERRAAPVSAPTESTGKARKAAVPDYKVVTKK